MLRKKKVQNHLIANKKKKKSTKNTNQLVLRAGKKTVVKEA
jgi:hypothetical protein